MRKYVNKSKFTGDVKVMEVSQSGVCTRSRSLALQQLQSSSSNPDASSLFYLQLRSRRLHKPLLLSQTNKSKQVKDNPTVSSRLSLSSVKSADDCEEMERDLCSGDKREMVDFKCKADDLGVDVSLEENCLDFENRQRCTRESTPCSLMKDSYTIGTTGSTTRQTSLTGNDRGFSNNMRRIIPTTHEMEEFFTFAEQQQQRLFIEKYNFDVVNDLPLTGRYEWVQVIP